MGLESRAESLGPGAGLQGVGTFRLGHTRGSVAGLGYSAPAQILRRGNEVRDAPRFGRTQQNASFSMREALGLPIARIQPFPGPAPPTSRPFSCFHLNRPTYSLLILAEAARDSPHRIGWIR